MLSRFSRGAAPRLTAAAAAAGGRPRGLASASTTDYDVVIVGGGVMGASAAYHTALADPRLRICVVERDTSYAHASAMLSAGGIRQQFSLPANIELSMYGVDFLRRLGTDLQVPGQPPPDVQFKEQGYLFLASPQGEATLRRNHATQRSCGVDWTTLLSPAELSMRYPWLNTAGVALGCVGEHSEGWFDPWALVTALRDRARHMGVTFKTGSVEGLPCVSEPASPRSGAGGGGGAAVPGRRITAVRVRGADGDESVLGAGTVVNAAGAFAGRLVSMMEAPAVQEGAGAGAGAGAAALPVAARKRCIFQVQCGAEDAASMPPFDATGLVVDPSGAYFRPEGAPGRFLCGVSPPPGHADPDLSDVGVDALEVVDHALFEEVIWPALYERCEAFGSLKVLSSWAGAQPSTTAP